MNFEEHVKNYSSPSQRMRHGFGDRTIGFGWLVALIVS
jgi:hypothetical protein